MAAEKIGADMDLTELLLEILLTLLVSAQNNSWLIFTASVRIFLKTPANLKRHSRLLSSEHFYWLMIARVRFRLLH